MMEVARVMVSRWNLQLLEKEAWEQSIDTFPVIVMNDWQEQLRDLVLTDRFIRYSSLQQSMASVTTLPTASKQEVTVPSGSGSRELSLKEWVIAFKAQHHQPCFQPQGFYCLHMQSHQMGTKHSNPWACGRPSYSIHSKMKDLRNIYYRDKTRTTVHFSKPPNLQHKNNIPKSWISCN